ncbi:hypothetical protein QEM11_003894 [Pseudomonas putida]|nr:hypothetical protein [Pseudomonas putida]
MIEEFKKGGYKLYAGRGPRSPVVGPILGDGSVVDSEGIQRFQIIDDGLYAASSELVGKIYLDGDEWIVPDGANNILYSYRRESAS